MQIQKIFSKHVVSLSFSFVVTKRWRPSLPGSLVVKSQHPSFAAIVTFVRSLDYSLVISPLLWSEIAAPALSLSHCLRPEGLAAFTTQPVLPRRPHTVPSQGQEDRKEPQFCAWRDVEAGGFERRCSSGVEHPCDRSCHADACRLERYFETWGCRRCACFCTVLLLPPTDFSCASCLSEIVSCAGGKVSRHSPPLGLWIRMSAKVIRLNA